MNALDIIHEQSSPLKKVVSWFWDSDNDSEKQMHLGLTLVFDDIELEITVGEDDSLAFGRSEKLRTDINIYSQDMSAADPWKEAIGLPLMWSWILTNQQGYCDGLQFEFSENVESRSRLVQIIAVAAEIWIRQMCNNFVDL